MEGIVLGRVGHYHVPNGEDGFCQTALVVDGAGADGEVVNVVAWTHTGDPTPHIGLRVVQPPALGFASFHLTRDCPWGR